MTFAILPPGATVFLDLNTLLYYAYFLIADLSREGAPFFGEAFLAAVFLVAADPFESTVAVAGPGDPERARSAPEITSANVCGPCCTSDATTLTVHSPAGGDWITTPSTLFGGRGSPNR